MSNRLYLGCHQEAKRAIQIAYGDDKRKLSGLTNETDRCGESCRKKWLVLKPIQTFQISQSHLHDDRHPFSTSLSSCSTGRSSASKKTSFTHAICPMNKLIFTETFFTKTLKAGKQWRSHRNIKS
jgi:hypothetical protein